MVAGRMNLLARIAEVRIREAIARGDFADLPGKGNPPTVEDLSRVPENLRAGYILLKNAGPQICRRPGRLRSRNGIGSTRAWRLVPTGRQEK